MPGILLVLHVLMQPAVWQPTTVAVKYSYGQGLPGHGLILMLTILAGGYLLLCVPTIADLVVARMRAGAAESTVVLWLLRGLLLALLYIAAFGALSRFG